MKKKVVYQVFTRLFGNTNSTNKPWGTIEENGVGKFDDFTDKALSEIRDLGVTHVWYTGILHHAVIRDYSDHGISPDDPDVVKGRAGSPYAVKDYFNVNPDLALNPSQRLEEFKALIDRTHKAGMKVIIDIVPNHIARGYEGLTNPEGVKDFGSDDDTSVEYARNNNFYYVPGENFRVPEWQNGYQPLGGASHPLSDGHYKEEPAKWTGNGARSAQPNFYDWYETVKVNYGVRPDGAYDFPSLPGDYGEKDVQTHFEFWKDKDLPDSWYKFRDITHYWLDKGVDGFRFDMAEMVPVEFWSFLNSSIKNKNPQAFLLAEVYNPQLYRSYIRQGKMDYLYDKVQLYDTLKTIIQGHGSADRLFPIFDWLYDIEHHMLHFLENHDEQRIASPEFAGDAKKGMPAMVISALSTSAPTMIYFGQEVGEPGAENAGFGTSSRTSIFDYIGVPHHQRWMNEGLFDGGQSWPEEKELRDFYKRLLNVSVDHRAFTGDFYSLHDYNRGRSELYNDRLFAFARWTENSRVIVASNFSDSDTYSFSLRIPGDLLEKWNVVEGQYLLTDLLTDDIEKVLDVTEDEGQISIDLAPLKSHVLQLKVS